jgi:hypothetical protein
MSPLDFNERMWAWTRSGAHWQYANAGSSHIFPDGLEPWFCCRFQVLRWRMAVPTCKRMKTLRVITFGRGIADWGYRCQSVRRQKDRMLKVNDEFGIFAEC